MPFRRLVPREPPFLSDAEFLEVTDRLLRQVREDREGELMHTPASTNDEADLTGRKLFPQVVQYEPDEIIGKLARFAIFGAANGHPTLPLAMAACMVSFSEIYSLDELRQLEQLKFLRH